MTTYLTNTQPGHFKFWSATIHKHSVFCSWGRIGTFGQSKRFPFNTTREAVNFINEKVASKLRRGYVHAAIGKAA